MAQAIAAQAAFQQVSQADSKNFNPQGLPALIDPNGFDFNSGGGLLGPKYSTPYSTQLNLGIQQQIGKTMFVSADYEHNTNVHDILVHDLNLVGAARTLDVAAAQTAITTTNSSFGCATVSCAIAAGATITDYAANGLGSPVSGLAEQFAAPNGGFAFPGLNPNFGQMGTITTTGRSNYNAFQFRVRQGKRQPVAGIDSLNWQVSYNLSRFLAMSPDQDASLVNVADNTNPTEFYGPTNLDRTHMISAAGTATLRGGLLHSPGSHESIPGCRLPSLNPTLAIVRLRSFSPTLRAMAPGAISCPAPTLAPTAGPSVQATSTRRYLTSMPTRRGR